MIKAVTEAHVRDSLATCLEKLELGLTFLDKEAKLPSSLGTTGFIDLLAKDAEQRYVLVEVKKTGPATRETLHEILKYIEGIKSHLGLREHELRVIVASVEWRELLLPFSSFLQRTTCRVDGYQLQIDDTGAVVSASPIEPIVKMPERVIAPWHELRFYHDERSLVAGIDSYEKANATKGIESFVLIIFDAPVGYSEGFPSTKQIANRQIIAGIGHTDHPVPLYKSAIYFAMQQLSKAEYISRLPNTGTTVELLQAIADMDEEEAVCTLHESVLDLEPHPTADFFEIGYAAKFRARLIDEEGWQVRRIQRYGHFQRNALLTDETIVSEIGGAQGNARQTMSMSFVPSDKSEIAEVRRRVDECLCDNAPWRSQINFALSELANRGEKRKCYIHISNPSSAMTTVYLAATRENGALYIPTYQIRVPENDTERMYFGVLKHNGGKPRGFKQILNEFYEGDERLLLFTLQWGGYESRDVEITRRLGLRYKTFYVEAHGNKRDFFELDNHEWEECEKIDPITAYFTFLLQHEKLTEEICKLYEARWDGSIVNLD